MYESFAQALTDRDIKHPNTFAPGTAWRYPAESKGMSNKSGSGKISDDGEAMFLIDHTTGHQETVFLKRDNTLSPEDKRRYAEQQQAQRIKAEQKERAATKAVALWKSLVFASDDHPYLIKKGVKAYKIKQKGNKLVVPLRHKRNIVSLQYIHEDGAKKFMPDGRTKGAYFPIGDFKSDIICICEGYATGASIHEATGYPVVVTFNAGNIKSVAENIRATSEDLQIIICSDNDRGSEQNIGLIKAQEAANAISAVLAVPEFDEGDYGTDFNDLVATQGLRSVNKAIVNALANESPEQSVTRIGELSNEIIQTLDNQEETGLEALEEVLNSDPLEMLRKFSLKGQSEQMERKMLDDTYVMGKLALQGQTTILYAPPNSGKTLLTLHLLIEAINSGSIEASNVYYINADDNYKGLITKTKIAERHGFEMLSPNYNDLTIKDITGLMLSLIESDKAHGIILIIDTLKKFVDLMDKKSSSDFANLMRGFTSKQGTIIAHAHVNKHKDSQGKNIHSGTSDMKDDSDCVYVVTTISDRSSQKVIEFENIKNRGNVIQKATYSYSKDSCSYEDILNSVEEVGDREREILKRDAITKKLRDGNIETVNVITSHIKGNKYNQINLIKKVVEETGESKKKVRSILLGLTGLHKDQGALWNHSTGDFNSNIYYLL